MIASITAGIVLGLSAGFSPGPFLALVISQSLEHGPREGVKVAFAPLITDTPIVLFVVFLLARVADSRVVLGAITLAGGAFLLYLAYESFRATGPNLDARPAQPQSVRKGVMVNFLNPHPYLFWLTVGCPIIIKAWAVNPFAAMAFLAGFYGCLIGSKVLVAVCAGSARRFFAGRPYVYTMRFLGVLLLFFAASLFWSALHYVR